MNVDVRGGAGGGLGNGVAEVVSDAGRYYAFNLVDDLSTVN
jgi:hypothetical protein